jgi:hypothetical protein
VPCFPRRSRSLRLTLLLCLATAWPGCGPAESTQRDPSVAAGAESPELRVGEGSAALGEGFAVWESNRSGNWRIWTRRLDGSGLRQLVPDEAGHQHCCPLISPDGRRVLYLSQRGDWEEYPEEGVPGELRLRSLEDGSERVLAARARTYDWGDRAAVWRSDREVIYVGADGRTFLLDLGSGMSRPLTREPREAFGWLVDATLAHATTGKVSFSVYDPESRRVLPRRELGGCEPYFSHDGRWGYWIAGGGGPIDRIDLATGEISTLVAKNDPRLGAKAYLYFPMLSRDGRLLAFGASAGEHDHFRSDYEIFAFPTDPETLEIAGPPLRLTDDPATDRYPDVFLAPLPLGRHRGEAPFTVEIEAPGDGAWTWQWGDGAREPGAAGRAGRHLYAAPGTYRVSASRGGTTRSGLVVVDPPRPPRVVELSPREGGRQLRLGFDEPIRLGNGFAATLGSGLAVSATRLEAGGRALVLELAGALTRPDRLTVRGIEDRAQRPNRMPETNLDVAPPSWPAARDDLAFLWRTGDSPNLVRDPETGADRTYTLESSGRAHLDHAFRMRLGDGAFAAPEEASDRLLAAAKASNELTLEATLTPREASVEGLRRIVAFSSGKSRRNFTLGQEGRKLVLRLRTGKTGANADRPQVDLFELTPGESVHVAVTYTPGRLRVYRDGESVLESGAVQGSFGMHWRPGRLVFGDEWGGGGAWPGELEGIAIYSRALPAETVREDWLRYRRLLAARPAVPRSVVRARLTARSEVPSLAQISPYRRALAVYAYDAVETLDGPPIEGPVRVARWVILDGDTLDAARRPPGRVERLVLERFADNPQLEGVYLSETLDGGPAGPLYYAVEP